MHILDVLFYNYYLFQTKVISKRGKEPFAMTVFTLSMTEYFLIFPLFDIIFIKLFCKDPNKFVMALPFIVIIATNYFVYQRSGRSRKVVGKKPCLWGNKKLSITFAILFTVVSYVLLYIGVIYAHKFFEDC
jgi:hypothetical protein